MFAADRSPYVSQDPYDSLLPSGTTSSGPWASGWWAFYLCEVCEVWNVCTLCEVYAISPVTHATFPDVSTILRTQSKLTPSRGFCAELATAFVIMLCSQVWGNVWMPCTAIPYPSGPFFSTLSDPYCLIQGSSPLMYPLRSTACQPPPLSASPVPSSASDSWRCVGLRPATPSLPPTHPLGPLPSALPSHQQGVKEGINWRFFGIQFMSWVATLFVCGLGTAALFSQVSDESSKGQGPRGGHRRGSA